MAQTGTNTKKKKSGTAKKTRSASSVRTKASAVGSREEIAILIAGVVCLLLFLGDLGLAGSIGNTARRWQFGLLGSMAWLFPFLLLWAFGFACVNGKKHPGNTALKLLVSSLTLICICGLLELSAGGTAGESLAAYLEEGGSRLGGGWLGGLCLRLCPFLGIAGTWVVLGAAVVIGLVFMTGRSVIGPIRDRGSRAVKRARKNSERRRKKEEDRREEEELRREEEELRREEEALQDRTRRREQMEQRRTQLKAQSLVFGEETKLEPPEPEDAAGKTEDAVSKTKGAVGKTETADGNAGSEETQRTAPGGSGKKADRTPKKNNKKNKKKVTAEEISASEEYTGTIEGLDEFVPRRETRTLAELEALDRSFEPEEEQSEPAEAEEKEERLNEAEEERPDETEAEPEKDRPDEAAEERPEPAEAEPEEEQSDEAAEEWPDEAEAEPKEEQPDESETEHEEDRLDTTGWLPAGEKTVPIEESPKKETPEKEAPEYCFPPIDLLKTGPKKAGAKKEDLKATAARLQQTLRDFGVGVTVTNISCGPAVTRYELHPEQGVKVSRIVALQDDIKLNLAAPDIRIEAPIPGKAAVGIEVPNAENQTVYLRELIDSDEFKKSPSNITFGVGKDIAGKVVVADLAKMPHLLIAGATGSGKSVCINTMIMSILYKAHPDDVKFIMIDPKVVELSIYNGIPHLMIPVVTDPKKAAGALNWAVSEMTDRYRRFADAGVRDIESYNKKAESAAGDEMMKMPQIVVIVDELADLMMVASGEVEEAICRLAQLARAAGIHLVLATQRPSVNVITGLIKANVPSRIAFATSSGVDSRTILDMNGAEKLLGRGDMLFYPSGYPKPVRVQGSFVSENEVSAVVEFLTSNIREEAPVNPDLEKEMEASAKDAGTVGAGSRDELFVQAGEFIIEKDRASIGNLQRAFRIGFNRAARIMDQLAEYGVVGPDEGTKARQILMTAEEFQELVRKF